MTALEAWIFAMMIAILHPETKAKARHLDILETWQDYADTSMAMADVIRSEDKLLFSGSHAEVKTAAVLLSIAKHETAFTNNISGDGGRSHCMMAVMTGIRGRVREGTGEQLKQDKTACFRAGLRIARSSFRICGKNPLNQRLNVYASGSCDRGAQSSARRMNEAIRLWNMFPDVPSDLLEPEMDRFFGYLGD